jgi:hypothetical protein
MTCFSCASGHEAEFGAEVNIHLPGVKNLDKSSFFMFPKILVCLDCGSARFAILETELKLLRERIGPSSAV